MISNQGTQNGWTVTAVTVETIDGNNVGKFKAALAPLLTPGVKLILDLGAVEFMDSSALGSLLTASRTIEGGAGTLRLANLTPPVRTLFELVRLHRVFEIMNDVNEAAA